MTSIAPTIFKMAKDFAQDKKIDNSEVKKLIDVVLEDDKITVEEAAELRKVDEELRSAVFEGGSSRRLYTAYNGSIADIPLYKKALEMEKTGGRVSQAEAKELAALIKEDGRISPAEVATLRSLILGSVNINNEASLALIKDVPSIMQAFERSDLAFMPKNPIPLYEAIKEEGIVTFVESIAETGWTSRVINISEDKKVKIDRSFDDQGRILEIKVDNDNNGTIDETHKYSYKDNRLETVEYYEGTDPVTAKNKSFLSLKHSANGVLEKESFSQMIDGKAQDDLEARHTTTANGQIVDATHNNKSFKELHAETINAVDFPQGNAKKEQITLNKNKTVAQKKIFASSSKSEIDSRLLEEEAHIVNDISSVPMESQLGMVTKNPAGQIISANHKGQKMSFIYNNEGQLTQVDRVKGTFKSQINYTYDTNGKILDETISQKLTNAAGTEELKKLGGFTHSYDANDLRTSVETVAGEKIGEKVSNKDNILLKEIQFDESKEVYSQHFKFNSDGKLDEYSENFTTDAGTEVRKDKKTYDNDKIQKITLTDTFIPTTGAEITFSTTTEEFNTKGQLTSRHTKSIESSPIFSNFRSDFATQDFKGKTKVKASHERTEKFKYRGNGEFRSGTSVSTEDYNYIS